MGKRIMRRFRLGEISGVDSPAQKGALAVIMKRDATPILYLAKAAGMADLPAAVEAYLKRDFSDDKRKELASSGAAMPDGSFPIENRGDLENAIRAIGRAKDPEKAKSHVIARARALDATSLLPQDWKAGKSLGGDLIQEIAKVAPRLLPDLLDNVVKAEEIEAQIVKLDDKTVRVAKLKDLSVAKSAVVASAWSILDSASPEDRPSLLQKNFAEYKDHVIGLVPAGTELVGEESMKAIAKSLGLAETATEAEILAEMTKRETAWKADAALAKMSGKHKAFMENDKAKMPSGGKEAFQGMSADARDAHMAANPIASDDDANKSDSDCIKMADGTLLTKRDFGTPAAFAFAKSQSERIEKGETALAVEVIAKRVTPLKFVIGKADDTAALLYRIEKGRTTPADAEAIEKMLTSANALMAKSETITKEFGKASSGEGFAKAIDEINAKAVELQKADPKLSIEKARTMARKMNPDAAKREEDEAKEARRAA